VNIRERLFTQRELKAWGYWSGDGCTFQNPGVGYPMSTVEYAIMQGTTGGSSHAEVVPTKFNLDKNIEIISKVCAVLPEVEKEPIYGVYRYRMPEERVALILGVSTHVVLVRLWAAYEVVFAALSK
jgi:hypothetical protein